MKIKVKLFIFLIAFIFHGTLINQTRAQEIPLPSPPPPPPAPPVSISKNKQIKKFETVDYVFVLQIDINTNITLSVQDTEKSNNVASVTNTDALTDFFSILDNLDSRNTKTISKRKKINPSIIVKAEPNLNFGTIADFLKRARKLSDNNIKLETSKDFFDPFVVIPEEHKGNLKSMIKPNPLTLIVQITSDRKITLNNQYESTLYDSSSLRKNYRKFFEREKITAFSVKEQMKLRKRFSSELLVPCNLMMSSNS